jgi:diguanylate cyclase (GGDEF)-like protein
MSTKDVIENYKLIIKGLEDQLKLLNDFDPVTGLSSSKYMISKLDFFVKQANGTVGNVAVLFIDLDGYRKILDAYGMQVGSELLKYIGKKLKECIRENDTISRIDGDQFIILLTEINDKYNSENISERILDIFKGSFQIDGHDLYITASIGVVLFPVNSTDVFDLLNSGNSAIYAAKEQGKNQYQYFKKQVSENQIKRYNLENELRHSVKKNEFIMFYQPIVKGRTNKVAGMEALIRWLHPQKGLLPPIDFIDILEETGLIIPIGTWVINTVCKQNKIWQDKGYSIFCIAVNISVKQLQQPDFVEIVKQALSESGLEAKYLELEITESVLVESMNAATKVLDRLKELGVIITLDDFGTGYSSLNYLKSLPIDKIKIDKSFTWDINKNSKVEAIISAIVMLSNRMKLEIVAEGVETTAQLDYLIEQGCELFQGYLYSKPLPLDQIEKIIIKTDIVLDRDTFNFYQI